MKKGLFFSFEGVDGCGKSTQIRFLAEYLTQEGYQVLTTREPGGCPISEQIREILLSKESQGMEALTEAFLYAAARVEHVHKVILPALEQGKIVLCDRFIDSSLAYQGVARDLGISRVLEINRHVYEICRPDATIYLQFAAKDCFERMNENKELDRLELEGDAFFAKVQKGFEQVAKQFPDRILLIDASGSKYETQEKVQQAVLTLLAQRN